MDEQNAVCTCNRLRSDTWHRVGGPCKHQAESNMPDIIGQVVYDAVRSEQANSQRQKVDWGLTGGRGCCLTGVEFLFG